MFKCSCSASLIIFQQIIETFINSNDMIKYRYVLHLIRKVICYELGRDRLGLSQGLSLGSRSCSSSSTRALRDVANARRARIEQVEHNSLV